MYTTTCLILIALLRATCGHPLGQATVCESLWNPLPANIPKNGLNVVCKPLPNALPYNWQSTPAAALTPSTICESVPNRNGICVPCEPCDLPYPSVGSSNGCDSPSNLAGLESLLCNVINYPYNLATDMLYGQPTLGETTVCDSRSPNVMGYRLPGVSVANGFGSTAPSTVCECSCNGVNPLILPCRNNAMNGLRLTQTGVPFL